MMGNYSTKAWIESTKDCHHTPKNLVRCLDSDLDPRSPSLGIQRTPIFVENFDESSSSLATCHSSESMEYEDAISEDKTDSSLSATCSDPSMVISELNLSEVDSSPMSIKVSATEDKEAQTAQILSQDGATQTVDSSPSVHVVAYSDKSKVVTSSPNRKPDNNDLLNVPANNDLKLPLKSVTLTPIAANPNDPLYDARKKLFSTATRRKPLESVQNTSSPQQLLRAKWRDFQEEREKLGIKLDENTPPPKFDGCASAPGKLVARRRALANAESPPKLQT